MRKRMQSIISLFYIVCVFTILFGCNNTENDYKIIDEALASINFPEKTKGDLDFANRVLGYNDVEISYVSKNPTIISNDGVVTRQINDIEVDIDIIARKNELQKGKSVKVTVIAISNNEPLNYLSYSTVKNEGKFFEKNEEQLFAERSKNENLIKLNTLDKKQEIIGFGGTLTHGSAYAIYNSNLRSSIIEELFSESGSNFTTVRIPIGSSDFPTYVGSIYDNDGKQISKGKLQYFSLSDIKGNHDELSNFNLNIDLQELIPVIKEIIKINPNVKFMAAPWSAPAWMKTTNNLCGGSLKKEYEDSYVNYLCMFIEEYAKLGIKIDYISLQNEPGFSHNTYPTMSMEASQQARLVKKLGEKLLEKGLKTKIIVLDHNTDMNKYITDVLSENDSEKYIDGIALHGYSTNTNSIENICAFIKRNYPKLNIYFTEMTAGNTYTNFNSNLNWAAGNIVIPSLANNCQSVLYFNFVLYNDGMPYIRSDWIKDNYYATGLIQLDNDIKQYFPEYYLLKHLSKFATIKNGKSPKYLNVKSLDYSILSAATITEDKRIALTLLNVASVHKDVTIKVDDRYINTTLFPNEIITFVWDE